MAVINRGVPHLRTTFWDLRSMHQDPLQAFIVFLEIKGGQNSSHHFPDLLGLGVLRVSFTNRFVDYVLNFGHLQQ